MQITESDGVLLGVIAHELTRLSQGAEPGAATVLGMAAELLGTIGQDGPAPSSALTRDLDLVALKRRLMADGLASADARLRAERSSSGFSKDTFLIELEDAQGARMIVVRRDLPAGTTRTRVADEYPVLQRLARAGLAVAEPLLLETDPAVLGQPFIVMRGVAGQIDFPDWQQDEHRRREGALDLARVLARLHGLPPGDTGLAAPGDTLAASDAVRGYVNAWREMWLECRPPGAYGHIDDAYARMLDTVPAAGRAALVHGDVGFHNILMEDAKVVALVDWEFAHLGDPAEDLSYCRPSIESLMPWVDFMRAYHEAGGEPCDQERLDYYNIWRGVRNATCCAVGIKSFESAKNIDLRLAYAGRILINRFSEDIIEQLRLAK